MHYMVICMSPWHQYKSQGAMHMLAGGIQDSSVPPKLLIICMIIVLTKSSNIII